MNHAENRYLIKHTGARFAVGFFPQLSAPIVRSLENRRNSSMGVPDADISVKRQQKAVRLFFSQKGKHRQLNFRYGFIKWQELLFLSFLLLLLSGI